MNRFLLMGLFAFVIFAVALWRILAERDLPRLQRMRQFWGRTLGLGIHFTLNVGLPLIVGIVFTTQGIVGFNSKSVREKQLFSLPESRWQQIAADLSTVRSDIYQIESLYSSQLPMP